MLGALVGTVASMAVNQLTGGGHNRPHRVNGRRRYGHHGVSYADIIKLFGELAFLPAPRIPHAQLQGQYKGGVNPINPYSVATPYTGGRVRGLFIGINYFGTRSQLSGCINDVAMLLDTLRAIQFPLQEACILVDDPNFRGCSGRPTRQNIIQHMQWLIHDARPGDVFILHFSGHGSQTEDRDGDEEDGMDETMVPVDYQSAGCIVDDDIFALLVKPLPPGVRMTAVMDCCHSGSLMDLPFTFEATSTAMGGRPTMHANRKYRPEKQLADVVMFSGCGDSQTSSDVGNTQSFGNTSSTGKGKAGGACTNSLCSVLTKTRGLTYVQILQEMRKILHEKRFTQIPELSSSKPIDMHKPFSFFGPVDQGQFHSYQQYQQQNPHLFQPPPPQAQYPPPPHNYPQPQYPYPQPQGGYPSQYPQPI